MMCVKLLIPDAGSEDLLSLSGKEEVPVFFYF